MGNSRGLTHGGLATNQRRYAYDEGFLFYQSRHTWAGSNLLAEIYSKKLNQKLNGGLDWDGS